MKQLPNDPNLPKWANISCLIIGCALGIMWALSRWIYKSIVWMRWPLTAGTLAYLVWMTL